MREFLQSAFSGLYEIENRMNELYCQSADGDMAKLSTAASYQEELERKEFYLINTKIEQVATGLGLTVIGPTNFWDKEHVTWLAEYLSRLPNAFLAVSNDYDFLEKISTRICDIDNEKITKFFKRQSCRNL